MTKSERTMMQKMGIWIDHKEAFLVSLQDGQTTIERIESNAESHFRPSGGWKSSGTNVAQSVSKEQTADERRKHQFRNFYLEVIERARNASLLYIFGPGEAKGALCVRIPFASKNQYKSWGKVRWKSVQTIHQRVQRRCDQEDDATLPGLCFTIM